MGWKLRKDKLRAGAEPEQEVSETAAVETSEAAAMPVMETPIADTGAHFELPTATAATEPVILDTPSHFDEPAADDTQFDSLPAFEPIAFAPADEALPAFDEASAAYEAPVFVMPPPFEQGPDAGMPIFAMPPVDPVVISEPDTLNAFAPYHPAEPETAAPEETEHTAFAPFEPEAETTAFAPLSAEPIALHSEPIAEEAQAFTVPDEEDFDALQPEVGAMAFDPQAATPIPLNAESEMEEISTPVFEPSFAEPDTTPGEPLMAAPVAEDEPFMNREALAAGLVSTEPDSMMPRVSPFVLGSADTGDYSAYETGPRTLVVRLGSLSATYILIKPVTTIGRPDSETNNYPDVEVELDDGVSRKHAEVRHEGDEYLIVDLGSTNGTSLNGEMLTPDQPVPLMHGDHIRLGERTEIVFE